MNGPSRQITLLSLVVPMYNEEQVLCRFFEVVLKILTKLQVDFEIVCVNDGSQDKTLDLLLEYKATHPQIKVVDLARNFGKEAALTAGLACATGNVIIPIDADLQDPPSLIPQLIEKWQQGYDNVLAVRSSRNSDSLLKRATAKCFYKFFNQLADRKIPANTGDFRLLDRKVVQAILALPEKSRFMKGLFNWVGFKTTVVYFDRDERAGGKTSWSYLKLWNFALDGLVAFTTLPLRVWSYIGLAISFLSGIYIVYLVTKVLIYGHQVPGYASIMVAILFMGGIQLISLGVLGEYVSRIYHETKNRPLYIINKLYE